MIFTLEALQAKHGDALFLHYGKATSPQLIVIDGGPSGIFKKVIKPRLNKIKQSRIPEGQLPIRLLMISHIDDDHIRGVLDLSNELVNLQDEKIELPYKIITLWHNSFDDIVGNKAEGLFSTLNAAVQPVATGGAVPSNLPLSYYGALMVASVKQGRDLRNNAKTLHLDVNYPFGGLVLVPKSGKKTVKLDNSLSFTILGPQQQRVEDLQEEWDKKIKKLGLEKATEAQAIAAAFVDNSVYNLASIIVMAELGSKKMLLTGDARGDDIIYGLKKAKLIKNDKCYVDLLKVPHHGSDRNVSTDFFRIVKAKHYVISADGKHGNPEISTLKMLSEARGQDKYTIYLTNKEPRLVKFFNKEKASGKKYNVVFRRSNVDSIQIDLGDSLNL